MWNVNDFGHSLTTVSIKKYLPRDQNVLNLIPVPDVVVRCARFVEEHGITDGIYRVSGIASNIKRLRSRFIDDDQRSLDSLYGEQWIVQVHF